MNFISCFFVRTLDVEIRCRSKILCYYLDKLLTYVLNKVIQAFKNSIFLCGH